MKAVPRRASRRAGPAERQRAGRQLGESNVAATSRRGTRRGGRHGHRRRPLRRLQPGRPSAQPSTIADQLRPSTITAWRGKPTVTLRESLSTRSVRAQLYEVQLQRLRLSSRRVKAGEKLSSASKCRTRATAAATNSPALPDGRGRLRPVRSGLCAASGENLSEARGETTRHFRARPERLDHGRSARPAVLEPASSESSSAEKATGSRDRPTRRRPGPPRPVSRSPGRLSKCRKAADLSPPEIVMDHYRPVLLTWVCFSRAACNSGTPDVSYALHGTSSRRPRTEKALEPGRQTGPWGSPLDHLLLGQERRPRRRGHVARGRVRRAGRRGRDATLLRLERRPCVLPLGSRRGLYGGAAESRAMAVPGGHFRRREPDPVRRRRATRLRELQLPPRLRPSIWLR